MDEWVFLVLVGCTVVPRDASHANGWDYTDGTYQTITIYGPSCEPLMNGSVSATELVFTCLTG